MAQRHDRASGRHRSSRLAYLQVQGAFHPDLAVTTVLMWPTGFSRGADG